MRISNMEIRGAGRGLHVQCCYGSPKPGSKVKVGVDISDVTFENVTIRNATESICVMSGSPVANATLRDIFFRNVDAESYLSPALIADGATYPENVRFDGCRFRLVKDPHPVKAESL